MNCSIYDEKTFSFCISVSHYPTEPCILEPLIKTLALSCLHIVQDSYYDKESEMQSDIDLRDRIYLSMAHRAHILTERSLDSEQEAGEQSRDRWEYIIRF